MIDEVFQFAHSIYGDWKNVRNFNLTNGVCLVECTMFCKITAWSMVFNL